jgi:ribonuclease E
MLIDAAHAEETRVVVVDGTRIEEFDFESRAKKQLRGNIYLAKVTRVEPSLQAAFIEYGGNRHGFLAFNEIHPDYYQIPLADREALLREEAEEDDEPHAHAGGDREDADETDDDEDDVMEEELARRRRRLMRRYKIQEVIKRRQIMLVQVVKEERGNKGAALTTYLSLAGRYCVLMPNTARGGGVSRKITSATDRKRLKGVIQSLDTPEGMGLIVRTAGAKRTKAEIKRDYEYLMRLWENIRDITLKSVAPSLIYEEEDLVKRAIRDMYDKDLDGIEVEGEEGYREAKEFMRMLMPSQAKKITAYREPTPLFIKARVEDHLAQIYNPVAPLKSGGYLVINQTEALVAIDVNSGKATRERNIEATALKTNMEAAEEAARQLRLRDLAGLIVIDFIDMEEAKNNRAVEKVLKDCLKDDRARIQMGKISAFGLMEISRQRRRTGVLEGTTHVCPHCQGIGRVRSVESSALSMLRAVELEAARGGPGEILLRVPGPVALYILNQKRAYLMRLQQTQGVKVTVQVEDALSNIDHEIERLSTLTEGEARAFAGSLLAPPPPEIEPEIEDVYEEEDEEEDEEEIEDDEDQDEAVAAPVADEDEDEDEKVAAAHPEPRAPRDEAGRGGRRVEEEVAPVQAAEADEAEPQAAGDDEAAGEDHGEARRRRRGRRGGRRAREEVRAVEPYSWVRVRVPHVDGVYSWYDPALAMPQPRLVQEPPIERAPAEALAIVTEAPPAAEEPAVLLAAPEAPADDIWVELPTVEAAPARAPRSRRARGRSAAAETALAEPVARDPLLEAAPSALDSGVAAAADSSEPQTPAPKRTRTRSRKAAPAPAGEPVDLETPDAQTSAFEAPALLTERIEAPVAAPVAAAPLAAESEAAEPYSWRPAPANAPEPVAAVAAAAEPDPAEILSPPAQPRRGWWRRG